MFRDEDEQIAEEIEDLLNVYSIEDILNENDMTVAEALAKLVLHGYIVLPENKPV